MEQSIVEAVSMHARRAPSARPSSSRARRSAMASSMPMSSGSRVVCSRRLRPVCSTKLKVALVLQRQLCGAEPPRELVVPSGIHRIIDTVSFISPAVSPMTCDEVTRELLHACQDDVDPR